MVAGEAALQNLADAPLPGRQEAAALLVAEDNLTNEQIAAKVGVTRQSIDLWKRRPDFAARVTQHKEAFKNRALTEGFADKRARLALLDSLAQDVSRWLGENAYERTDVKVAANGEAIEYKVFDQARYAQLRGTLDDIAKELGERGTNVSLSGDPDRPLVLGIVGIPLDEV